MSSLYNPTQCRNHWDILGYTGIYWVIIQHLANLHCHTTDSSDVRAGDSIIQPCPLQTKLGPLVLLCVPIDHCSFRLSRDITLSIIQLCIYISRYLSLCEGGWFSQNQSHILITLFYSKPDETPYYYSSSPCSFVTSPRSVSDLPWTYPALPLSLHTYPL